MLEDGAGVQLLLLFLFGMFILWIADEKNDER